MRTVHMHPYLKQPKDNAKLHTEDSADESAELSILPVRANEVQDCDQRRDAPMNQRKKMPHKSSVHPKGSFTYEWREPDLVITSAPSYFSSDFQSGEQLCDSTTLKGTFLTGCAFLMPKHYMSMERKIRVVPNVNRGIKERIKCASTAEI